MVRESRSSGGRLLPLLCNLLGIAIILIVILFCLCLMVPRLMGYEMYAVVSGSMEPEIPVGSVIVVNEIEPENICDGDIIAFWSGGSVVSHRVVENRTIAGEFVTKGDANDSQDIYPIPYRELIGIVVWHLPRVGQIMTVYTSPAGKLYVLGFAACGLLFNVLGSRLRTMHREKQEPEKEN